MACQKQTTYEGSAQCRCRSRSRSHCSCSYEEREYKRYSPLGQVNNREASMDRTNCSQPLYQKDEIAETRRECQAPIHTQRYGLTEGIRRSLTPAQIWQPVPKSWMATVTSGTNAFRHVEPPAQPAITRVCQEICQCQVICERTSGSQGPDREQQHICREFCCELCQTTTLPYRVCSQYPETLKREPQYISKVTENKVIDLSKVVPPDVAVCPKGVENQHNLLTETMEKDVGGINIKKTTIYEETVELLSPDRARSPKLLEQSAEAKEPCRVNLEDETDQRSSVTLDREVESISDRTAVVQSTEALCSAITTAQLMDNTRKEEEEKSFAYEKICCEEKERLHRQELDTLVQQRRYGDERARCNEMKRIVSSGEERTAVLQETRRPEESCHGELIQEFQLQKSFQQLKDKRHQSSWDLNETHHCIQEQQVPEKSQSLQERRLYSRFRDTIAEGREQLAEQKPQHQDTYPKKHVQFVAPSKTSVEYPLPTTIENSTAKEWESEMVKALTTASERPYSPFDGFSCQLQKDSDTLSQIVYSTQIKYDDTRRTCQELARRPTSQEDRAVSPFQTALLTAPERPYTPLGSKYGEGYNTTIYVSRSRTPVDSVTREGYYHPAEILYTDDKTRETQSRERNLQKIGGPQPLPIPPQDHRLRDSVASPARSLSRPETPKYRSIIAGFKKPGSVPLYQKNLVSMQQCAIESQSSLLSRSPTPNKLTTLVHGASLKPPGSLTKVQAGRIRESPTRVNQIPALIGQEMPSPPALQENNSCYVEEDSSTGHHAKSYHGIPRSSLTDDFHRDNIRNVCKNQEVDEYRRSKEESSIAVPRHDCIMSCKIGDVNRVKPMLTCPLSHSPGSEKFPKTGIRVLPTCFQPVTLSQSYDTSRYSHKPCTTCSSTPSVEQGQDTSCSNSRVITIPSKTTANSETEAGIIVVPDEDSENTSCCYPRISAIPLPDRAGVCISPSFHGRTGPMYAEPSASPGSERCINDIGNCPASGVSLGTCGDGSPEIDPSVQCPKPTVERPDSMAELALPQILSSDERDKSVNPCDSGSSENHLPFRKQDTSASCLKNVRSFQPIREARTNLSNQLTRLTIIPNNQNAVQLSKPRAQSRPLTQCFIMNTQSQTKTQYRSSHAPGPTCNTRKTTDPPNLSSQPNLGSGIPGLISGGNSGKFIGSSTPTRGRGILNQAGGPGSRQPLCGHCKCYIRGPFITALGQIWCPDHFICSNSQCGRALQDIGFVEEKGQLHCEYCFERFIAPACSKCNGKIKGDCLNAVGKHFHPECFNCSCCGKLFGNSPFFLEEGLPYCKADWNELFTTKCYACGFPVEAGDRWVEALNNNYHSQCFNCTMCRQNLEGQSFYAKGGRPFCKNHAR